MLPHGSWVTRSPGGSVFKVFPWGSESRGKTAIVCPKAVMLKWDDFALFPESYGNVRRYFFIVTTVVCAWEVGGECTTGINWVEDGDAVKYPTTYNTFSPKQSTIQCEKSIAELLRDRALCCILTSRKCLPSICQLKFVILKQNQEFACQSLINHQFSAS